MKVKEIMHKTKIVSKDVTVLDVARIAREERLGSVLIEYIPKKENVNERYGIVTERDVLKKIVAEGRSYKTKAVEIMSYPIYTIDADARIKEAARIFNLLRIRRLPIVEGNKIVGMLTARDLAKYYIFVFDDFMRMLRDEESRKTNPLIIPVEKIIHEKTVLPADVTVYEAAKVMKAKNIGSVFIDKGEGDSVEKRYGILTERDIFYKVVAENRDPKDVLAAEVMSPELKVVMRADECICDASKYANLYDIRRLPVKKDNEIIGLLTTRDIAKFSAFAFSMILEKLREVDPEGAVKFEEEHW